MNLWPLTSSWPHTSIMDFLLLHYPSGSCISFFSFCFVLWFWTLMWSSPSLSARSWAELVLIFDISWCRFLIRLPGCRSHTHVPVNRTIFMLCFFCLICLYFFFPQLQFLFFLFFVKLNLFVDTFSDTCHIVSLWMWVFECRFHYFLIFEYPKQWESC